MTSTSIAIVGAGMGGLSAAVALSNRPDFDVILLEAADRPGGKVDIKERDGVEFDTGPSLLTLPTVLEQLLAERDRRLDDLVDLVVPDPTTRYHFGDITTLDVTPEPERTTENVRHSLGASAADEFRDFLDYTRDIWEAASPHFVFGSAPTTLSTVKLGFSKLRDFMAIDSMKTMVGAVDKRIDDPRLRSLFLRYASFHGSDPRQAPATLHCIGWVDIGLGGYGVEGGMYQLVRALEQLAAEGGVDFRYDSPVTSIRPTDPGFELTTDSAQLKADYVVVNADVRHFADQLFDGDHGLDLDGDPSASGWTAVVRARRRPASERPAHTVVFPRRDYIEEYVDLFDHHRPPAEPTIYLSAREKAHRAEGWSDHEPLFVMTQAPPVSDQPDNVDWTTFEDRVLDRLRDRDLIAEDDEVVWRRTPDELAGRFPNTAGSIYGTASNSRLAAFRRPPNSLPGCDGLFLAGGSVHPGGGVPLAIQSGRQAVEQLFDHHR